MPVVAVPPPPAPIKGKRAATFQEEVIAMIPADSRLETCIQCGTCGGSCPSSGDMDHTPRQIFALIRAGARDRVLASNTPWMCVSCYLCTVRCPQQIHITDVMYALKAKATQEGRVPSHVAPSFSECFVDYVHKYGRSFEVGLVAKHYLRHYATRLPGMAQCGVGMVTKGRMSFRPHKIKGIEGLNAILDRAAQIESERQRAVFAAPAGGGTH
jgi:quinone-modifying oxidoreductase subunit QmoC